MGYVMELQSEGEVINSAYAFTLKEVRTIARQWKPRSHRLTWNVQAPRKKTMLTEGGQGIAEFYLPGVQKWQLGPKAYIYVQCDTETIERHFDRLRKKMEASKS